MANHIDTHISLLSFGKATYSCVLILTVSYVLNWEDCLPSFLQKMDKSSLITSGLLQ